MNLTELLQGTVAGQPVPADSARELLPLLQTQPGAPRVQSLRILPRVGVFENDQTPPLIPPYTLQKNKQIKKS